MRKLKYPCLLFFLFVGLLSETCYRKEKKEFEKVLFFERNSIAKIEPEFVCNISEDSVLLGEIKDFTFLNDTSFVVTDGHGAYLYNISF